MPDARIPYTRQGVAPFVRNDDEAFRLLIEHRQVFRTIAVHYDNPVQSQVRDIHQIDSMRAIAQQQVAKRLRVFRVSDGELDGLHECYLLRANAIQQPSRFWIDSSLIMRSLDRRA